MELQPFLRGNLTVNEPDAPWQPGRQAGTHFLIVAKDQYE
jgi:hypothetical protein